jgi:hypothetical protein
MTALINSLKVNIKFKVIIEVQCRSYHEAHRGDRLGENLLNTSPRGKIGIGVTTMQFQTCVAIDKF